MPHLSLVLVLFPTVAVVFVADAPVIHHHGLRMRCMLVATLVAMMRTMILAHATGHISSASVVADVAQGGSCFSLAVLSHLMLFYMFLSDLICF